MKNQLSIQEVEVLEFQREWIKLQNVIDRELHLHSGFSLFPLYKTNNEMQQQINNLISFRTIYGNTALHLAVEQGQAEIVKLLIRWGANVNSENQSLFTPLHFAANTGHIVIGNLLISKGAKINAKASSGFTPLHIAAQKNLEMTSFLVYNKADPYARTNDGYTPFLLAALANNVNIGSFFTLLEPQLIPIRTNGQKTCLHLIAREGLTGIFNFLTSDTTLNINAIDKHGVTPLHFAAKKGHLEIVRGCIKLKANINQKTYDGFTPLHYGIYSGNIDVVKELIRNGANVSSKTARGTTPLSIARSKKFSAIAKVLIDNNADIDTKTKDRSTPLYLNKSNSLLDLATQAASQARAGEHISSNKRSLYTLESSSCTHVALNSYDQAIVTNAHTMPFSCNTLQLQNLNSKRQRNNIN
jgi:ankyrin repeat protein